MKTETETRKCRLQVQALKQQTLREETEKTMSWVVAMETRIQEANGDQEKLKVSYVLFY